MKKHFILIIAAITISCNGKGTKETESENNIDSIPSSNILIEEEPLTADTLTVSDSQNDKPYFEISEITGSKLISMTIYEEKSNDPYNKYGFDFGGYCYGCDAAEIYINKESVSITNGCGDPKKEVYKIKEVKTEGNSITIESENIYFKFEKIETAPIYQLTTNRKNTEGSQLQIREFYTTKKNLKKFSVHDCGDFQG